MTDRAEILEALDAIDPSRLEYGDWVQVGMALKDAGLSVSDWETWSRRDADRHRPGECERKWAGFNGSDTPVTASTVFHLARDHGWNGTEGYELTWDSVIGPKHERIITDTAWVEGVDVSEPAEWDPVRQLTTYLETLFEANENVGYVTTVWEKDGSYMPTKGNWDRTAGELIQDLDRVSQRGYGDLGAVLGDYKPEAGAWIRFNPLDGRGVKNSNVTEFRYALVESDTMPIDKQYAIIRELELPVAVLVHSGGKSLHAIVRIDAADYAEYRKRVDHLYSVCRRNGLEVDAQNKNPSRLSRMPGVTRAGRKQYIVATSMGRSSWADWVDWMDEVTDTLPVDVTDFCDEWDEPLVEPVAVIDGIVGADEKMMLSGPSKAGKSFALLELCAAIAEGDTWMGRRCKQGHILYINLELKRESRIRRLKEVYRARGYSAKNASNIHSLDLRGHSAPLAQLTSKIIRQAAKYQCVAIIIDPIYKVMDGDENNAESVAKFCNQLDALSQALDCSIVYCHHYSKGQQGQKASMDRASGSGVFARDVDALIAMTELDITDDMRKSYLNGVVCEAIAKYLDAHGPHDWRDTVAPDDQVVAEPFRSAAKELLGVEGMNALIGELETVERAVESAGAWRLESTLREFAPHKPIDIWYRWPIHEVDQTGILADAKIKDVAELEKRHRKGGETTKKRYDAKREEKKNLFEMAIKNAKFGEGVTRQEAADYIGEYDGKPVTKKTIQNWMKSWPEYDVSGPESGYIIIRVDGGTNDNS